MKFGKFNKKWGVSIFAAIAICGLAITPLVSNANGLFSTQTSSSIKKQSSLYSSKSNQSNNTNNIQESKYEDANGNIKRNGITSDADISIDMLRYQLKDTTTLVEMKSIAQLQKYLERRNSVFDTNRVNISSVDNSKSKYFPEIDTQGSLNSCTTWATAYYQMTYAVNKALDRDGKLDENVMSPTWVYNLINQGENQGTFYSDALLILSEVGCVPITTVPIENYENGDNIVSMNAYKENWLEARKYRVKEYYTIDLKNDMYDTVFTCNTDADLDMI